MKTPIRRIEVGLGSLSAQTFGGTSSEFHDALSALLIASQTAESAGLDSVWISEHHFSSDAYLPSPMIVLAAISRETERIRLSTNIAAAPLYNPLRFAEDCAVVDHLSDGRLMVGLGLGYRQLEFRALGYERSQRVPRLEETVRVLRAAWSGSEVRGVGLLDNDFVKVTPTPFQQGAPPILVGAFAESGIRRAARIADGWIAPELAQVSHLRKRIGWLDFENTVPRPFHIALTTSVFVAAKDAWETVRPGVEAVDRQYRSWIQESGDIPKLADKSFDSDAGADGKPPQFIAGRPEECARQLKPWWDELQRLPPWVTPHITMRMTFPGVSLKATEESINLLGHEVLPTLRSNE